MPGGLAGSIDEMKSDNKVPVPARYRGKQEGGGAGRGKEKVGGRRENLPLGEMAMFSVDTSLHREIHPCVYCTITCYRNCFSCKRYVMQ